VLEKLDEISTIFYLSGNDTRNESTAFCAEICHDRVIYESCLRELLDYFGALAWGSLAGVRWRIAGGSGAGYSSLLPRSCVDNASHAFNLLCSIRPSAAFQSISVNECVTLRCVPFFRHAQTGAYDSTATTSHSVWRACINNVASQRETHECTRCQSISSAVNHTLFLPNSSLLRNHFASSVSVTIHQSFLKLIIFWS